MLCVLCCVLHKASKSAPVMKMRRTVRTSAAMVNVCFITIPMSRSVCYCARKKCMLVQTFFGPYFFAGLAVYCAMVSAILLLAMAIDAKAA